MNQIAEIHEPLDIVSHRLSLAMIDFDRKYSNCENGAITPQDNSFLHVVSFIHFINEPSSLNESIHYVDYEKVRREC